MIQTFRLKIPEKSKLHPSRREYDNGLDEEIDTFQATSRGYRIADADCERVFGADVYTRDDSAFSRPTG